MNLFKSVLNIGKAVVDTALIPLDATMDLKDAINGDNVDGPTNCTKRARKIAKDVEDAYEETK